MKADDCFQADCFTQPDRLAEIRARHDFIHSNAAHCMTVTEMDLAYLLTELDRLRKLVKDVADCDTRRDGHDFGEWVLMKDALWDRVKGER